MTGPNPGWIAALANLPGRPPGAIRNDRRLCASYNRAVRTSALWVRGTVALSLALLGFQA